MGAAHVKGKMSRTALLRVRQEVEVQKHRINKARNRMSQSVVESCRASQEQGLGYKILMSRLNESAKIVKEMRGGRISARQSIDK